MEPDIGSRQKPGGESGCRKKLFQKASSLSLPKGGCAIRGMGDKLAASPATEADVMTGPITTRHGYVKRMICGQGLAVPSPDTEERPWPVRIYLLGHFMVEVDENPLSFPGKGPKKPLELLKALVAAGGVLVDAGWLGGQLWPDSYAVRDVFNVTLARLRKLLPAEDVLILDEGKLSLNPDLAWTDVSAFERLTDQCVSKLRQNSPLEEMTELGEAVLSLYSGELLQGEMDVPWLIAARDRMKSKFLRTLKALGAYWVRNEAWGKAQNLYERVLEIDTVAEDIYRHLMRCYVEAGQPAEALHVYRRCQQMLSLVLGIAPSSETETLFETISAPQYQGRHSHSSFTLPSALSPVLHLRPTPAG